MFGQDWWVSMPFVFRLQLWSKLCQYYGGSPFLKLTYSMLKIFYFFPTSWQVLPWNTIYLGTTLGTRRFALWFTLWLQMEPGRDISFNITNPRFCFHQTVSLKVCDPSHQKVIPDDLKWNFDFVPFLWPDMTKEYFRERTKQEETTLLLNSQPNIPQLWKHRTKHSGSLKISSSKTKPKSGTVATKVWDYFVVLMPT